MCVRVCVCVCVCVWCMSLRNASLSSFTGEQSFIKVLLGCPLSDVVKRYVCVHVCVFSGVFTLVH